MPSSSDKYPKNDADGSVASSSFEDEDDFGTPLESSVGSDNVASVETDSHSNTKSNESTDAIVEIVAGSTVEGSTEIKSTGAGLTPSTKGLWGRLFNYRSPAPPRPTHTAGQQEMGIELDSDWDTFCYQ